MKQLIVKTQKGNGINMVKIVIVLVAYVLVGALLGAIIANKKNKDAKKDKK